MSITEKFKEVFYLTQEDLDLGRSLGSADILPSEDILIRLGNDKLTVHYLRSSDQIIIPGTYINLFLGIDRLMGDILGEAKTGMELFLFLGSRFSRMLYGGDKTGISSLLSRMVVLGSKDLRRYLKTEFGYDLEPWTLRNVKNTKEI